MEIFKDNNDWNEKSIIGFFQYRTIFNTLAMIPDYILHVLQRQNTNYIDVSYNTITS